MTEDTAATTAVPGQRDPGPGILAPWMLAPGRRIARSRKTT